MAAGIHPLVDFLNHGILPFMGRGEVAEKIMSFWRGTTEAHGLQAMLLIGEAGIGKSRMVEEIGSAIKRANGAVVHMKLYPESATSIAPLAARAIWRFSAAHPLLKLEPEEDLPSVIAAIRRLARLRQTILIVEDIHLLYGEGLTDFAAFLDALTDEQIAVLTLARPVELGARALLERHLVDEIELEGLRPREIDALWRELFGVPADRKFAEIILRATTGNPLALRSALRGALKSGAIAQESSGSWRITLSPDRFAESLARSVRLLSEGMAAHLTEKERHAAEQIACLGEVVSREAALELMGGDESILGPLAFKGILVETGTLMPPLSGAGGTLPLLAFTHTLLHRRLAENASADAARIAYVVLRNLPLYSTVPFALLAEHASKLANADIDIKHLIEHILAVTKKFVGGPDWKLGLELWKVADRLFSLYGDRLSDEDRFGLEISLYEHRLRHLRGMDMSEEYMQSVRRFAELTDRQMPPELIEYRIHALRTLYWMTSRRDYGATQPIRMEVERLVAQHPELRTRRSYFEYLGRVANVACNAPDHDTVKLIEEELEAIRNSDIPEEVKRFAWRAISPFFIQVFLTPEELEARLRLLHELEADPGGTDSSLRLTKITMYINIGYVKEAREAVDEAIRWYRDRGQFRSAYYCSMVRLYCDAARGADLGKVEEEAAAIAAEADSIAPRIRGHAAVFFTIASVLRGIPECGKRMAIRLLGDLEKLESHLRFSYAIIENDEATVTAMHQQGLASYQAVTRYLLEGHDYAAAVEQARRNFHEPTIRMSDVLADHLLLDLLEYGAHHGRPELLEEVKEDIHSAIVRTLTWLDARGLYHYIAALVSRSGVYLTKSERTKWNARLSELAHDAAERETPARETRIKLSMLGAIEVSIPNQEPTRPRGVRLRTLLGLMAADRMLEKPLSQREFCRLAASDVPEFEDARKTVNLAVHRLREMLGHDAILTDQDTPRINPALVEVDLLRAHNLLTEALEAIRDGSLPRAYAPLVDALEITRGEVPFPTLYDDFFEAAREDFENRMRSAVLRLAKGMLNDGDAAGAEEILRRAFAAMPEDEELSDLLAQALRRLGKRTEAERVRMQAGGAVEV